MSCEEYERNYSIMLAAGNNTENMTAVDHISYVFDKFFLPSVCIFGIIGNILNLAVLTRKQLKNSMDRMEKSSHLGLVALAVSDLLFCLFAFPYAFVDSTKKTYYSSESLFFLYYKSTHTAIFNIFLCCSTWLTVVMAGARYLAICHPLHARGFINLTATKISILMVFIASILINLPWFWQEVIRESRCSSECTCYDIFWGKLFMKNQIFDYTFNIVWSILGVFLPIIILTFCNICLIRALRQSMRMQRQYRVNRPKQDSGHHITPTLIVIIILFLTLVVPSEVIKFVTFIIDMKGGFQSSENTAYQITTIITNFMQVCNFAVNFVLYCILNVHFRNTISYILCCRWRQKIETRKKSSRNPTVTLMTDIETDTI